MAKKGSIMHSPIIKWVKTLTETYSDCKYLQLHKQHYYLSTVVKGDQQCLHFETMHTSISTNTKINKDSGKMKNIKNNIN